MMTAKIIGRTSLNIISLLLLVLLLLLVSVSVSVSVSVTVATTNKNEELIEWLRSKGGYWNSKQTLTSKDGLFGVFANEQINENEILASIPWSCTIILEEDEDEDDTEEVEAEDRFKNCDMVQKLADEISKGNESSYASYVQGLVDTAKEHSRLLPSYWSQQGKDLLLKIIDNDKLPPDNLLLENDEWKKKCEKINKDTTLLVMTHGEDFGMVPITDKYNSRSGNWTSAYFSIAGGGYGDKENIALEIRAYRDIEPNEQIFTNYKDYGQIGTPELLRDYGFVEFYPQTWIFHKQHIAFDIIEPNIGELEINWRQMVLGKRYNDEPRETTIKFLREQLQRLEQDVHPAIEQSRTMVVVESENEEISSSSSSSSSNSLLSEHEFQIINRFYNALTAALRLAITDLSSEKYNIGNGMHGEEF
jgi:hypothetical protein